MADIAIPPSAVAPQDTSGLQHRKQSVVELTDEKGRRKTVQLDEMSAADRELAEKFGYKPV
jgi:hypothetical protein